MTDQPPVHVTDHAVLLWLEREHGIDIEAIRDHIAGLAANGARLGATNVHIGKVKLALHGSTVTTTLRSAWPRSEADK